MVEPSRYRHAARNRRRWRAALDARLRLMDRAAVDIQVLSAAPRLPYGPDADKAQAAARFVNDEYAELVSRHHDRFRAFAATPMPHVGASISEMGRARDELGMVGVVMNTTVAGQALTDRGFEPVFAELAPSNTDVTRGLGG